MPCYFYTSGFYAWHSRTMRTLSSLAGLKLASYVSKHYFVVADVKSGPKEVVEISVDEDVSGKGVVVRLLVPQIYRR